MKKLYNLLFLLLLLAVVSACNKDSDSKCSYTCRLTVESTSPESSVEEKTITEAFEKALGGNSFEMDGDQVLCDLRVLGVCQTVAERLDKLTWKGSYTFEVYNLTTGGSLVYAHTFATALQITPEPDDEE